MPKTKEIGRNFREKTGGIFLPFSALQQTGNEIKRLVATRTICFVMKLSSMVVKSRSLRVGTVCLLILTFNLNYSLHFQNFNEKFRRESSMRELFISPLLIYLVLFHSKTKKGIEFRIIIFPRRRDREIRTSA